MRYDRGVHCITWASVVGSACRCVGVKYLNIFLPWRWKYFLPFEMFVLIRLHTEDYKTKDLGVISNYIKLGTGFNRERNASCYKETNLKIRKWHNPSTPTYPPGPHTHTLTHSHSLTHSLTHIPVHVLGARVYDTFQSCNNNSAKLWWAVFKCQAMEIYF